MLSKWFSLTRLETRTKESNIYASIWVCQTLVRNESEGPQGLRVKPGETLVEARSGTDVQIVRLIWVKLMIRGTGGEMPLTYSQTLNRGSWTVVMEVEIR
eukprot:g2994.t1